MSWGSISRPSAYIMSFCVSAWANWPGRRSRERRRSAGPSTSEPSGIVTFESMGALPHDSEADGGRKSAGLNPLHRCIPDAVATMQNKNIGHDMHDENT